jgi:hypothetical protein
MAELSRQFPLRDMVDHPKHFLPVVKGAVRQARYSEQTGDRILLPQPKN